MPGLCALQAIHNLHLSLFGDGMSEHARLCHPGSGSHVVIWTFALILLLDRLLRLCLLRFPIAPDKRKYDSNIECGDQTHPQIMWHSLKDHIVLD